MLWRAAATILAVLAIAACQSGAAKPSQIANKWCPTRSLTPHPGQGLDHITAIATSLHVILVDELEPRTSKLCQTNTDPELAAIAKLIDDSRDADAQGNRNRAADLRNQARARLEAYVASQTTGRTSLLDLFAKPAFAADAPGYNPPNTIPNLLEAGTLFGRLGDQRAADALVQVARAEYRQYAEGTLDQLPSDANGIRDMSLLGRDADKLGFSDLDAKAQAKARADSLSRIRQAAGTMPCPPTTADATNLMNAARTAVLTGNDENASRDGATIINLVQAVAVAVVRAQAQQPDLSQSQRHDLAEAARKASRPDLEDSIKKGEKVAPPQCAGSADLTYQFSGELFGQFVTVVHKLHAWSCENVEGRWQATLNSDYIGPDGTDHTSAHMSWEFAPDRHQSSIAFSDVQGDETFPATGGQAELLKSGSGWSLQIDGFTIEEGGRSFLNGENVDGPITTTMPTAGCR